MHVTPWIFSMAVLSVLFVVICFYLFFISYLFICFVCFYLFLSVLAVLVCFFSSSFLTDKNRLTSVLSVFLLFLSVLSIVLSFYMPLSVFIYFICFNLFIGPMCTRGPIYRWVLVSLTHSQTLNLTDVTLADKDTNSIPTDYVNMAI